ncbi:MAG: cell wall metabolism sensor histidine kinase WalK [Calothrix sp. SM1_7_51]|nr:cell wall metabolism sensor histidine kinase WalK [Calothrix sp. SM1_7_51]
MATSVVLSVVTSTFLAVQISQAISRPLKLVTSIAQRATFESNFDLQASINSQDELGVLASSLII